jgi:hypothetical protein
MAALVYSFLSNPGSVHSFPRFPLLIEKIRLFGRKRAFFGGGFRRFVRRLWIVLGEKGNQAIVPLM